MATDGNDAVDGQGSRLTSFVGRRREIDEVKRVLGEGRLLTLSGPGGVGKTRLAERVMERVVRAFGHGAVFVGLAELRDGDLLANLVADRLGLQDRSGRTATEAVLEHLRPRRQLVVLDNCEHLVAATAEFVNVLLAACPDVVVMATSRQSLGAEGERVLPVPPLRVSDDAVELFVDRARWVFPKFDPTAEDEQDVLRICRELEGLPLAIELAAARIRSLSLRQLADRLSDRLALLTTGKRTAPERQQTLRATLDWSYELCSQAEQAVWARASVFAGSFDLEAAENVCAGPQVTAGEMLDVVDALLDKSVLVREERSGVVRYRMLETLREYGHERLEEDDDVTRVARLHRDHFDQLTETADAEWTSPSQVDWVRRIRADHANLRTALGWSLAEPGEAGIALRMAGRLDEYWSAIRGFNAEAQLWLDRALAATPPDDPQRPYAMTLAALYSLWQTKLDDANARLAQAEKLAARVDDDVLRARITHVRSFESLLRTRVGSTRKLAEDAAAAFAERGMLRREMHPLFIQGVSAAFESGLAAGLKPLRRMIELSESCGEVYYRGMAYFGLTFIEVIFGDADDAAEDARRSLRVDRQLDAVAATAYRIDSLAWVASRQGQHEHAATLFGAAATMWASIGSSPDVAVSIPHLTFVKATKEALSTARFEKAFEAGQAMSTEQAVAFALDENAPARGASGRNPLTPREAEIAALVAQGLTNRDIAAKLVIAPRTADTHVQHILTKLGFTNRAQIAAWVARQ